MANFRLLKRLESHDKRYGEIGAAILAEVMNHEVNGYCFKYPTKKAAAIFDLDVKQFKKIVRFLATVGAVCVAGNAIVSNPHRWRFKNSLRQYNLHDY